MEIWGWKDSSYAFYSFDRDIQQFHDPYVYYHRRPSVAPQSQIKGKKSSFLKFGVTMNPFPVQSLLIAENNFPALILTILSYFLSLKKSVLNLASWRTISEQSLDVVEYNFPAVSLICDPS